jgi:hypothetical protein
MSEGVWKVLGYETFARGEHPIGEYRSGKTAGLTRESAASADGFSPLTLLTLRE